MATATKAREWLAAQDGPRTSREIANAIGGEVIKVQWAVAVMLREGLLRRVRASKPCTYAVAREAAPLEERVRMALRARQERAVSRKAERKAAQRAAAEERKRERERTSAARKRQRALQRREYDKARYSARIGAVARYAEVLDSKPVVQAPVIRAQTVEEFLAMGGKVERLATAWGG